MNRTSSHKQMQGGIYDLRKFAAGGETDDDNKPTGKNTPTAQENAKQGIGPGGPARGGGGSRGTPSAASAAADSAASEKSAPAARSPSQSRTATAAPKTTAAPAKANISAAGQAKTPTAKAASPNISSPSVRSGVTAKPSGASQMAKTAAGMVGSGPKVRAAPQATVEAQKAPQIKDTGNLPTKADTPEISKGAQPAEPDRIGSFFAGPDAAVVTMSEQAKVPGHSTTFNAENSVEALRDTMKSQLGFENDQYTDEPNLVNHLSGEVGTTGIGSGQVAQTMVNRAQADNYGDFDAKFNDALDDKKQWASIGSSSYKAANNPKTAGRVADQAIKEMMDGVPAPNATDFRGINQPGGVKTKKTGVDVAGNRFGNFEGVKSHHMAGLKAGLGEGASAFKGAGPGIGMAAAEPSYDVHDTASAAGLGEPGKGNLGAPANTSTVSKTAAARTMTEKSLGFLDGGIPGAEAAEPEAPVDLKQISSLLGIPSPTGESVREAVNKATPSITGGEGVNSLTSPGGKLSPPTLDGGRKNFAGAPPREEKYDPLDSLVPDKPQPPSAPYNPLESLAPPAPRAPRAPRPVSKPGTRGIPTPTGQTVAGAVREATPPSYDAPIDGTVIGVENLDPLGGRNSFAGAPPGNMPTPTGKPSVSPDARVDRAAYDAKPSYETPKTYDVEGPVMDDEGNAVTSKPVKEAIDSLKGKLARGEIGLDEAKKQLDALTDGKWSAGLTKGSVPKGYVGEKVSLNGMTGYVGVDKGVYNIETPKTATTTTTKPRENPFKQEARPDPTPKDPNLGLGVASLDSTAPLGTKKQFEDRLTPDTVTIDDPTDADEDGSTDPNTYDTEEFRAGVADSETFMGSLDERGIDGYVADKAAKQQGEYSSVDGTHTTISKNDDTWSASGETADMSPSQGAVTEEDQAKVDAIHERNGEAPPATTKSRIAGGIAGVIAGGIPGLGKVVSKAVAGRVAKHDADPSYVQEDNQRIADAEAAKRNENLKGLSNLDRGESNAMARMLHDQWSQGVNIPNPDDPLYTEYELWLAQNGEA